MAVQVLRKVLTQRVKLIIFNERHKFANRRRLSRNPYDNWNKVTREREQ